MVITTWYELLYNLFVFTVLVPLSLGLVRWRLLTRPQRWVLAFLGVLLLHELLSILCITLHTRNHFLYYIQTVAVLCSVAGVYDGTILPERRLWWLAALISVLMVVEILVRVGFNHINSSTLSASRLIMAVLALISLNRLFSTNVTRSMAPNPMVYIHIGFFVFGAFSAVTAYFKSYFIETSLDLYYLFNNISAIMSAIAFGFFSVGFFKVRSAHRPALQS